MSKPKELSDKELADALTKATDHAQLINSKNKISICLQNDNIELSKYLNELKGSYAVQYVLEELLRRGNTHTLQSALKLLKKGRK